MNNALIVLALAIAILATHSPTGLSDEPPTDQSPQQQAVSETAAVLPNIALPNIEEARRRAEILHETIHATLQIVHRQYYREDEGLPLPAAVLADVFDDLEKEKGLRLRWLAVDGQAMNADHKAKDPFESAAVKALKSGKRQYELADGSVYRRAGAITLSNHCLKCHVPDRTSLHDRTAGLIISMPVSPQ